MSPITANRLAKFVLSVNKGSQRANRSTLRIAQLKLKRRIQVKVFKDYGILRPSVGVILSYASTWDLKATMHC